ncbi:hypothetical protein PHPALM_31397, partial [Phytophthora palmivora]
MSNRMDPVTSNFEVVETEYAGHVVITGETNRYSLRQVDLRTQVLHREPRGARPETLKLIRSRLKKNYEYETHEVLQVFTFIVGRELSPQKRQFADHWPMVEDDVVSAGIFGRFIGHNRYQDICGGANKKVSDFDLDPSIKIERQAILFM